MIEIEPTISESKTKELLDLSSRLADKVQIARGRVVDKDILDACTWIPFLTGMVLGLQSKNQKLEERLAKIDARA